MKIHKKFFTQCVGQNKHLKNAVIMMVSLLSQATATPALWLQTRSGH